ncbi:MAG: HdeD family acid-resistance protein, partial [Mesorhizobium sp.]
LIASGLLRSWVAFSHRPEQGWGWLLAAGIITILLGLMIAMGWPVNSLWVLGIFLAIDLVFQGWSFIAIGLALKR